MDPLDDQDFFDVSERVYDLNDDCFVISWESATGRLYTVRTKTDLMLGWTNVTGWVDVSGTGATMSYTNGNPVERRQYYRIEVGQP